MSALIALALAAQAATPLPEPGPVAAGPFVVSSEVTEPGGAPYPTSFRITHLTWRSRDGLIVYDLSDTGETIAISYEVGVAPDQCLGTARPYRFATKPKELFNAQMFLGPGCAPALSPTQAAALRKEIRAVRGRFARAYRLFIARSLQQHGPSRTRCREIGTGYHGPTCQRYWDEAPSASAPAGLRLSAANVRCHPDPRLTRQHGMYLFARLDRML